MTTPRHLTDDERAQMRRWLEIWRETGPWLERERVNGLRLLTEADAARIACDLWLLVPSGGGDDAEGLLPMKEVLRKLDRSR
jgi:hypothetical protein